jgi:polyhydroxybutyrate depolymerase
MSAVVPAPRSALLALALALSGCRSAPPCTAESAPCSGTGKLSHGGRERSFAYHLPPRVEPGLPLLLSLHGRLVQGRNQADLTGFDAVADEAGFLVVYPDGLDRSWADGRGTTPAETNGVDDVGFLSALIDHFASTYGADTRRVYSAGMSNGALMSYRLACELSGRVAAIAPVAGLLSEPLAARCAPARPVPVVSFLGTEDELMPLEGGELGSRGRMLSAQQTREWWARNNGCASTPERIELPEQAPEDGTRVRREGYGSCREGAEVTFYVVEGGGHTWPQGLQYAGESLIGRTSQEINASRTAWDFLARFRLP